MLHHNNSGRRVGQRPCSERCSWQCAAAPAFAEDILVTQYKADPSGAPYGVAIDKGFFKNAGVDITGVISGEGGGSSVRAVIASELGYGETSPAGIIAAINEGQDIKIVDIGSRSLAEQRHHRDAELADQDHGRTSRARSSPSAIRNRSAR